MGLTMSERKAVTKKLALDYRRGDRARKGQILDQVCELNGWHRAHARKALTQALVLKVEAPTTPAAALWGGGDQGVAVPLGGAGHAVRAAAGRGVAGPCASAPPPRGTQRRR